MRHRNFLTTIMIYSIIPLFLGFGIYFLKNLPIYHGQINSLFIFNLVFYQVPDFLWMYAFLNILWIIWIDSINILIFYRIAFLILAILLEVGQKWKILNGTYDILDICAYITAFAVTAVITKTKTKFYVNQG